jgi:outer membrane lipoprotein-sorting protein
MSSFRKRRSALLFLSVCVVITSCRTQTDRATNQTPSNETVVASTPPFQSIEPERYRATRTITIVPANGETIVTKETIAKDGLMRRDESETQGKRVVYLELPEGRLILLPDEKVYAAATPDIVGDEQIVESSPDRLLHTDPINTSYQAMGTESIAGRNTNKYRIVVNNAASGNVTSNETMMWIDEALKIPIKSETTSPDGTRTTMELTDLALDVDKQLFQVPADYEKIAFRDLWKQLKRPRLNP